MDLLSTDAFAAAALLPFGTSLFKTLRQYAPGGSATESLVESAGPGGEETTPSLVEAAYELAADPEGFIASIPQLAETHRKIAEREFGAPAGYDANAFEQTDAFITAEWSDREMLAPEATLALVGSYVGECIRRLQGGTWGFTEERGFHLDGVGGGARIYPFVKVAKRFENGMGDSLAQYYWSLSLLLERARAKNRA